MASVRSSSTTSIRPTILETLRRPPSKHHQRSSGQRDLPRLPRGRSLWFEWGAMAVELLEVAGYVQDELNGAGGLRAANDEGADAAEREEGVVGARLSPAIADCHGGGQCDTGR